jgi:hypothetical protein
MATAKQDGGLTASGGLVVGFVTGVFATLMFASALDLGSAERAFLRECLRASSYDDCLTKWRERS